ncbi:MAG: DUF2799 domain-containing protein [Proteobacteria bacterium]|nr:DUF2799 domain-containing protein [Pseudomonadota bacterium]
MKLLWLLLTVIVGFSGCASMTKEQCLEADSTSWERIGWIDGSDGWDPNRRLAMHQDACKEVRVLPDRTTYMRGWNDGVIQYCTPDRGYSEGLSGSSGNSGVCPPETRSLFDDNVDLGLRVYNLRNQINSLDYEISSYEKRLRDPKLDKETIRDLHVKIRNRDKELTHLRILLHEAQSIPIIRY